MKKYTLPELPYKPSALEPGLSAEILELHHDKHHRAYVDGANKALEMMAEMRESGDFNGLNQLQKDLAFNLSGHILHSMFWQNMTPDGGDGPARVLRDAIERDFGAFDAFREQMTNAATSIQGSGWASLAWEPLGERLVVEQVYDHQGNIGNATTPVLVLDMWEHAYYLQYKNKKDKWVESFWDIVNWQDVDARLKSVSTADLRLAA